MAVVLDEFEKAEVQRLKREEDLTSGEIAERTGYDLAAINKVYPSL